MAITPIPAGSSSMLASGCMIRRNIGKKLVRTKPQRRGVTIPKRINQTAEVSDGTAYGSKNPNIIQIKTETTSAPRHRAEELL